ncbi:REP-associated tyrosine transposase [Ectopseudomonas guguanensis]|uniref:REP-associated tyrosine transposase n=1 Tax=Ectopseudomonas guguanensis TaxID=1198456 RepID=UPI0012D52BCF|nr:MULTISPECIES: transposase [Pseudomonas]MPT19170.1 transposase [Pseudomonas sp.]WJH58670.1 transposase [Pseudomonas guguanensis]
MLRSNKPHAVALRRGRFSESGRVYLLTAVLSEREPLLKNFTLGRLLVAELRDAHENGLAHSLAWVVMPDHLHWLVQLESTTLNELMRRVKGRSARRINQRLSRTGPLWQPGFHDRALRQDEDLRAVARYVIANPVRAGLVKRVADYPLWDAVWL